MDTCFQVWKVEFGAINFVATCAGTTLQAHRSHPSAQPLCIPTLFNIYATLNSESLIAPPLTTAQINHLHARVQLGAPPPCP